MNITAGVGCHIYISLMTVSEHVQEQEERWCDVFMFIYFSVLFIIQVGTVVNFSAEIEVASCPADKREWKQTFKIYPVGIQEYLVVDLEMLCECPCENPSSPVREVNFIYFFLCFVRERVF